MFRHRFAPALCLSLLVLVSAHCRPDHERQSEQPVERRARQRAGPGRQRRSRKKASMHQSARCSRSTSSTSKMPRSRPAARSFCLETFSMRGRRRIIACSTCRGAPVTADRPLGEQGISSFRIDKKTGALTEFGTPVLLLKRPVHIATDNAGRYLLAAHNNPPAGLTVWTINADGSLGHRSAAAGRHRRRHLRAPDTRRSVRPDGDSDDTRQRSGGSAVRRGRAGRDESVRLQQRRAVQ